MKKIEQVYREILYEIIENKKKSLTQLGLSSKLGFSLSTINLAVKKLEKIGAIIIENRNFRVLDIKKILLYWASLRNLDRDIIYKTRVETDVREIEKNLPDVFYSCFSAYKFKFKDVPADYSEVYAYAFEDQINDIKKRFPEKMGISNLIILKADENMKKYSRTLNFAQIFVDLWNLRQWYAKDFLDAAENKLNKLLEKKE
ncbi:MAG: winged helix-turn-helix domain-containing protein [Nanoarchaeota archaeon]